VKKVKMVMGRCDYNREFEAKLDKELTALQETGAKILDIKPFCGQLFVGAFLEYEEAKPVAKPKPKTKAVKKGSLSEDAAAV
jgi:hypothetical protein